MRPAAATTVRRRSSSAISWRGGRPPRWVRWPRLLSPRLTPTDLSLCLPGFAVAAIREALPAFGRQIRGYDMAEAVMTGVETRTSSPIRIGRGADFQSVNTAGLFPAGEGAGYAGASSRRRGRHPGGGSGGAGDGRPRHGGLTSPCNCHNAHPSFG